MTCASLRHFSVHYLLCGPEGSVDVEVLAAAGAGEVSGFPAAGVMGELVTAGPDFGVFGTVVIALSGLSR